MAEEVYTKEEKTEITITKEPKITEEKPKTEAQNEERPKENGTTHPEKEQEEEDDGESSEEELGTLEKPVEILSRKRDRKSTDRFADNLIETKTKPEDELDYSKGRGKKLGEIDFIKHNLDKHLADDLKPLHNLLFRRIGKATEVKKNIRAFCGFPFDKESPFFTKVSNSVERFNVTGLKFVCGLLGVERGGDKPAIKDRLVEFLMEPKDLGKTIPQKKKKTPSKKKKTPKKASPSKSSKKKEGDISDASDDSNDEGDEKEEKKVEKPKKKKKSESPKKKVSKDAKKKKPTPVKIPVPKKKKKDTPKKSEKRKSMDSEEDDEPLVKKLKSEPSNMEIKKLVIEILKDADLEQVTMKTVCRQVYDRYPDFDLTTRKDFIKTTVKEVIS